MKERFKRFFKEEAGQGMSEYGLIIALVAIAVIGGLTALGTNLLGKFNSMADSVK
ncbi:MAG: Flp family type IVb pilin [Desulfitobacteriaceae bacterium]